MIAVKPPTLRFLVDGIRPRCRVPRLLRYQTSVGRAISAAVGRWPFKVAGFIAAAPAIDPDLVDALDQADPHLRGWITVGENDWVRDDCVALYDRATAKGFPWHLDLVQGLGHEFPEDFASRLIDALEFILDNGA